MNLLLHYVRALVCLFSSSYLLTQQHLKHFCAKCCTLFVNKMDTDITDMIFCWCAVVCLVDKDERFYPVKAEAQNNTRKY